VVVGMNPVFAQFATEQNGRPVGNDFVGVHVVAGSRTRLERINKKLVVPVAIHDLATRLFNHPGDIGIQKPQIAIHFCS